MKGKLILCAACLALFLVARTAVALEVRQAVITTAVIDREPVDSVKAFPAQDDMLYCYTRILGADEPTVVAHVWYRDDQVMSRVELPVVSPNWRTWSAMRMQADWGGDWRVEILNADGLLLETIEFQLR